MCKLLALLSICLALSVVRSDSTTCADTTNLRTLYGLGNTLTTPQTYSDIKYCKSIKGSAVCCTNTDMNTFQAKADKVLTNLSSVAGARDKFLYDAVVNVLPNLKSTITTFKTSFGSLGSSLGALGGSSDAFDSDAILGGLTNITDYLSATGSDLKTQFTSYQKARSTCITQMVKFQTAAFCLACDPSAASKGYSYSNSYHSFDISDTVCTRMDTACSSYFTTAVTMSAVSQVAASVQVMVKLNDLITKIQTLTAAGDINGIMALMTDMTSIFTPTTTDVTTGPVDPVCDPSVAGDCKSYCAFLFYDGMIDQEVLALAGNPTSLDSMYDDSGRLLRNFARTQSKADGGRMLSGSGSASFDPDEEESGVEVTFAQDPAGTQTSSKFGSLSLGNVFVSMMVVVSAILLF